MTTIVLGSIKGSPGVTTMAVALASVWPARTRPVVLAELDPSGGDIAARYEMTPDPGLVTLAAAARRDLSSTLLQEHCQLLPGGLPVLIGHPSAERARALIAMVNAAQLVAAVDGKEGVDLVIDGGRLDPDSPILPALRVATVTALVVRPFLSDVLHLIDRVATLRDSAQSLGVVVLGQGRYPPNEVAETLRLPLMGTLPFDRRSATMLSGGSGSRWLLSRLPLVRAARSLAADLLRVEPHPSTAVPDAPVVLQAAEGVP